MNHCRIIDVKRSRISDPVLPINLTTAKRWIKVTFDDDDDVIESLILDCIIAAENYTGMSIIEQDVTVMVDLRPPNNRECASFRLIHTPIKGNVGDIEVSILESSETNDFRVLTNNTDYWFIGTEKPLFKTYGCGVYSFVFIAGVETLDESLKQAILMELAYRYEHRGDEDYPDTESTLNSIMSVGARKKLQSFKDFSGI